MSDESVSEKEEYENRLQRRLKILRQQLDAGKVRFAKGLKVVDSLQKVRYAADGSVDLSTVDGLVRSMALAVEVMHDRQEMKAATSLAEIQSAYFEFLEKNFGAYYEVMDKRGLTPHDAGMALSRTPETIAEISRILPHFLETITEFWNSASEVAHAHVEDMHDVLKGVFGGDLFPSAMENIASKCGLYTDTIILPDPFLRTKEIFERASDEKKAYFFIKHGLNLLRYKSLACADVVPPIVVVLPDRSVLEPDEKQYFFELGESDAVIHANKVFGREFVSFAEVIEFAMDLDTAERVVAEIADESRVLFDTEWTGTIAEQILRACGDPMYGSMLGRKLTPGLLVASQAIARMGTSNELLYKAQRLHGTPIVDAPTSWQYFVWKLEYDASRMEKGGNVEAERLSELHMVRGLQSLAENEMQWLGSVPPAALIEIRKAGALGEVRSILSKGIEELASANPTNFFRTTDLVFDNINVAFVEHQKNIDALRAKQWKFAGSDVGSWLVVGSLAVTAAATGTPAWGLAAIAADQLLAAPKLKDIPKSIRDLAQESSKIKRSPVGMLFKISKP